MQASGRIKVPVKYAGTIRTPQRGHILGGIFIAAAIILAERAIATRFFPEAPYIVFLATAACLAHEALHSTTLKTLGYQSRIRMALRGVLFIAHTESPHLLPRRTFVAETAAPLITMTLAATAAAILFQVNWPARLSALGWILGSCTGDIYWLTQAYRFPPTALFKSYGRHAKVFLPCRITARNPSA